MGEIAEMMLNGEVCQGCGGFMGEALGYPGYCSKQCAGESSTPEPVTMTKCGHPRPSKIRCPDCDKLVKKAGLRDHQRVVHGTTEG